MSGRHRLTSVIFSIIIAFYTMLFLAMVLTLEGCKKRPLEENIYNIPEWIFEDDEWMDEFEDIPEDTAVEETLRKSRL